MARSQNSAVGELKFECQALESPAEGWDFIAGMQGVWLGMKKIGHIGSWLMPGPPSLIPFWAPNMAKEGVITENNEHTGNF